MSASKATIERCLLLLLNKAKESVALLSYVGEDKSAGYRSQTTARIARALLSDAIGETIRTIGLPEGMSNEQQERVRRALEASGRGVPDYSDHN